MGKFKVGQHVMALRQMDDINVGDVVRVTSYARPTSLGEWVNIEGKRSYAIDGSFLEEEFEAWQPKVGDRVRVVKAVLAHKSDYVGREFTITKEAYKVDNGVQTWGGDNAGGFVWRTDEIEPLLVTVAAEAQPDVLTIEAGKFYKTRDCRKVGPIKRSGSGDRYWMASDLRLDGYGSFWCESGSFYTGREHENDLIAEWVDEPAKASNDNAEPAKPKFKVGDKIRHKSLGYEGVVKKIRSDGSIETHWTKEGWGAFDPVDDIELIAPTTPAIVALIENGTAKPSTRPKVHADQAGATTEAERLALAYPGQQFGVFVLADSKIADVVNIPTAVLRAA